MRARSGFWSVFTGLLMLCNIRRSGWKTNRQTNETRLWEQALVFCSDRCCQRPLRTTTALQSQATRPGLWLPKGCLHPVRHHGCLQGVPEPLGLLWSARSLPSEGEDVHLNSSKIAEATETQFHWHVGRTVIRRKCCVVRRDRLLCNFVLTRRAVLRSAVTQQGLASWSSTVQKQNLESLSHTLAPGSWFPTEFAGAQSPALWTTCLSSEMIQGAGHPRMCSGFPLSGTPEGTEVASS